MTIFGPRLCQGRLLNTDRTRAMTERERFEKAREWECRVFAHYSPCDKRFVAEFRTPQMAAEFVRLVNEGEK